jgi:hypothetical protein
MTYVTAHEVEAFTGFSYLDFKESGITMTETQWNDFLNVSLGNVDQMIHRYCNVTSFDPATTVVEYHSGRGQTDDTGPTADWITSDREFYLREVLYSFTSAEEDVSAKTEAPSWSTRTKRTTGVAGDYEVLTTNELTKIVYNQNVPAQGSDNVRFTYKCGYGYTTQQYKQIKFCALRMMSNYLLHKKKIQEAATIRAQGVRDYSQMFDIMNESAILTENIKLILDKYKRIPLDGDLFL